MSGSRMTEVSDGHAPGARVVAGLALAGVLGVTFMVAAAAPYLDVTPEQYRWYWPRRWWLLAHIGTGTVALLSGPVQLWLGLARRVAGLHRGLGRLYVASVGLSSAAAYRLVVQTDFGWVFGAGLAGLATAWIVTTAMALVAIRRGRREQHRDWMVRSYVVTTGFVTFRLFVTALESAGVGTLIERLSAAAWFCWAIPLLITEVVMQWRGIGADPAAPPRATPLSGLD